MTSPLDPDSERLLRTLANSGHPPIWEVPPVQARESCVGTYAPLMPRLDPGATTAQRSIIGAPHGPIEIATIQPTLSASRGVGVYLHGGGWVVGDTLLLEAPARLVAELAEMTVVSVEYRRAPEDPFPAAFDDCLAAVRWASQELADGLPVVVFGESAGGNLAAAVTRSVTADSTVALAGQVVVVPALDPAMTTDSWARFGDGYGLDRGEMEWFWNSYLADPSDRADPRACPMLATSLGRCPPTTVVTCGYDPLQDEGKAYARQLQSAGVPLRHVHFDSLPHGFFWTAGISPAALQALQQVAAEVVRLVATA